MNVVKTGILSGYEFRFTGSRNRTGKCGESETHFYTPSPLPLAFSFLSPSPSLYLSPSPSLCLSLSHPLSSPAIGVYGRLAQWIDFLCPSSWSNFLKGKNKVLSHHSLTFHTPTYTCTHNNVVITSLGSVDVPLCWVGLVMGVVFLAEGGRVHDDLPGIQKPQLVHQKIVCVRYTVLGHVLL